MASIVLATCTATRSPGRTPKAANAAAIRSAPANSSPKLTELPSGNVANPAASLPTDAARSCEIKGLASYMLTLPGCQCYLPPCKP